MKSRLKTGVIAICALNILVLFVSIATLAISLKTLETAKRQPTSDTIKVVGRGGAESSPGAQVGMAINQVLDKIIQLQAVEQQGTRECIGASNGISYQKLHTYTMCILNHSSKGNDDIIGMEQACLHLLM